MYFTSILCDSICRLSDILQRHHEILMQVTVKIVVKYFTSAIFHQILHHRSGRIDLTSTSIIDNVCRRRWFSIIADSDTDTCHWSMTTFVKSQLSFNENFSARIRLFLALIYCRSDDCGHVFALRRPAFQTGSHPEMVGDMSRLTLNFDVSKIPFVCF